MITFYDKYHQTDKWYERVILLEVYHLIQCQRNKKWTVGNTSRDFNISIAMASECLKIARAMHKYHDLINIGSRTKALEWVNKHFEVDKFDDD